MTDLEELVRESLRTAPPVTPASSDPLGLVARRVRRARLRWGGGLAAVVAVLVAAVVVPLSLRQSAANRVVPSNPSASASPAPSPDARGVTVWQSSGAVAVTTGGGWLWELDDSGHVVKVDPRTHEQIEKWDVEKGAEGLAYGGGVVWVWTRSTHLDVIAIGGGLVQAVDVGHDGQVAKYPVTDLALDYLTVLDEPDGRADALVVVGKTVRQLRAVGAAITVVATTTLPAAADGSVVPTGNGDYWVAAGGKLEQLDLPPAPDGSRTVGDQPKDSVAFGAALVGTAGADSLWAYDGSRLVAVTPALLHQGQSVAVGDRIALRGFPGVVSPDGTGGLFVTVMPGQVIEPGAVPPGLYYVDKAAIESGSGVTSTTPTVSDASPLELAPDGRGGVDFVSDGGAAEHWQP